MAIMTKTKMGWDGEYILLNRPNLFYQHVFTYEGKGSKKVTASR